MPLPYITKLSFDVENLKKGRKLEYARRKTGNRKGAKELQFPNRGSSDM